MTSKSNVLRCVDVWDSDYDLQRFINDILTNSYQHTIFFSGHEWEWEININRLGITIEELNERLKEQGKTLDVLSAGEHYTRTPTYSNIQVHTYHGWWLIKAATGQYTNIDVHRYNINPFDINKELLNRTSTFQYSFCSLNNRSHPHRCLMMDMLAKHELIDKGAISWRNHEDGRPLYYEWKHFAPRVMLLSDIPSNDPYEFPNYYLPPKECDQSFVQLVSESTYKTIFVTEKTINPILCYRPFIVAAAPNFYKVLDQLGYVRYDELFDYSFDDVLDHDLRTEMIAQNIKRVTEMTPNQQLDMFNQLKPKLIHNFNVTMNYVLNENNWHPLLREAINYYNTTKINTCTNAINPYITMTMMRDAVNKSSHLYHNRFD